MPTHSLLPVTVPVPLTLLIGVALLTDEAVDRLRTAAGVIIAQSPEFKRLLERIGATIVARPADGATPVANVH